VALGDLSRGVIFASRAVYLVNLAQSVANDQCVSVRTIVAASAEPRSTAPDRTGVPGERASPAARLTRAAPFPRAGRLFYYHRRCREILLLWPHPQSTHRHSRAHASIACSVTPNRSAAERAQRRADMPARSCARSLRLCAGSSAIEA